MTVLTPTSQGDDVRYRVGTEPAAMRASLRKLTAMARLSSRSPPSTAAALSGVLHSKGFAVGDFELEEDSSGGLGDLFGVIGGLLRVRCWSTGEERMYAIGSGSTWLGAFLMDLARGHFARAVREQRGATGAAAA